MAKPWHIRVAFRTGSTVHVLTSECHDTAAGVMALRRQVSAISGDPEPKFLRIFASYLPVRT